MLKEALSYIKNGVNVLATDSSKTAIHKWTRLQKEMITPDEIKAQLSEPAARGLAIICGAISGGLEVIDVDLKYDLSKDLWERLTAKLKEAELFDLFKISKTRNGGYHLLYRCEVIEGNQPLASRPKTEQEQKDSPSKKGITLIETRGEAGYIVAPPSDGYSWFSGKLRVLSIDQRESLFEICRSFNEVIEPPKLSREAKAETGNEYGLSPFEDFNKRGDVVALLQKHGWAIVKESDQKVVFKRPGKSDSKSSGDFDFQKNWFSVFTTNSVFEPNKAYLPYAVFAMLECDGDFSKASKKLSDEGYGKKLQQYSEKIKRGIWDMRSQGADDPAVIQMLEKIHEIPADEAKDILEQEGPPIKEFWDVNPSNKKITVDNYKLQKFLAKHGFYLYQYDKSSSIFKKIRNDNGFVEEISAIQIKQFIKDYIEKKLPDRFDGITPHDLMNTIVKGEASYLNDGKLDFMYIVSPDFLKSDRATAFFPFNNGVIVIKGNEITRKSYSELNKAVWKNQVIDFDITVDQDFDVIKSEYYEFLSKISGGDQLRLDYCLSLIGYLLHAYKDAARPYAVILAEETETNEDGGGTGKGIFVKALGRLMNTVKVDGKNFKIDKNFALQRVTLDTQLISIEDCNKNLDFESFNSQITEGSAIEKKNKDELFIEYADSPKFVFSTNYMLNLKGNHGKRRSRVFEFAGFFGPERTPMSHFGHLLFDDWDRDEWIRFYNLMFACVSIYLQLGIAKMEQTDTLKRKTIRTAYGDEFMEWFMDYIDPKNFNTGREIMQMTLFNEFCGDNGFTGKDYSVKRFKSGLQAAAKILLIPIEFKKMKAGKMVVIGEKRVPDPNQNLALEMEKSGTDGEMEEMAF